MGSNFDAAFLNGDPKQGNIKTGIVVSGKLKLYQKDRDFPVKNLSNTKKLVSSILIGWKIEKLIGWI